MPDKDNNQQKEENQNKDKTIEIELSDFRQHVEDSIPFNGVVKNLWEIKHDPDAVILLHESDADEPTQADFDWLATSLNFGGWALGIGWILYAIYS